MQQMVVVSVAQESKKLSQMLTFLTVLGRRRLCPIADMLV